MRHRKTEHGQAIGELMISLVGLCTVTAGILMISALGMQGIRNTVRVREKADEYSARGYETGSHRQHIDTWKNGTDSLPFTNDDTAVKGIGPNPDHFLGELQDNTGTFKTARLAQTGYADHAFDSKVIESNLFLSAADLTTASNTVNDPLNLFEHFNAGRVLRAFGITSNFNLSDSASMPVNPYTE
ncbi:MAG: hypothetical protein IJS14_06245 [Lentisphaeria bacterium]|nr:hypothetical protein [Lentisphaeria bacterium]